MTKFTITNSLMLSVYLSNVFGKRFKVDFKESFSGGLNGSLDNKPFRITYSYDNFLSLSVSSFSRDIIDVLLPELNIVMGAKPICSYDLKCKGREDTYAMPTVEWDVVDPEARIKKIVNGRGLPSHFELIDLKLTNGKDPSDYLETEEEKALRIKNSRIYGIDPGNFKDVDKVDELSEVDIYLLINTLVDYMSESEKLLSHGQVNKVDTDESEYAYEYLVYQTKRFGVDVTEPEIDRHIRVGESYYVWYNFYENHFKHVLTDEEWEAFRQAKINGEDVSMYMPKGSLKDLINNKPHRQ